MTCILGLRCVADAPTVEWCWAVRGHDGRRKVYCCVAAWCLLIGIELLDYYTLGKYISCAPLMWETLHSWEYYCICGWAPWLHVYCIFALGPVKEGIGTLILQCGQVRTLEYTLVWAKLFIWFFNNNVCFILMVLVQGVLKVLLIPADTMSVFQG